MAVKAFGADAVAIADIKRDNLDLAVKVHATAQYTWIVPGCGSCLIFPCCVRACNLHGFWPCTPWGVGHVGMHTEKGPEVRDPFAACSWALMWR